MIKGIQISNFQSHQETELEFSPGVNIVIGQSDSGKTAVLRALQWTVNNRPLGDAFRSHWGGDTVVTLETSDCRVDRFKGKHDHYLLEFPDQNITALEFKAFGTEPPEEIVQALGLSDINIQNQHDNAFLISNNPGEVARHFNKVANIDKIDSSLKAVESWVRKLRQDVQATEEEITRHEKHLEGFDYLDKMEADVEALEVLEGEKEKLGSGIGRLSNLLTEIAQVEENIQQTSSLFPAEERVNKILELYQSKAEKVRQYEDLKDLATEVYETQNQINGYQKLLEDEKPVKSVLDLYNKIKKLKQKADTLDSLNKQIWKTQNNIADKREQLTELEKSWHENMPTICPLCGK